MFNKICIIIVFILLAGCDENEMHDQNLISQIESASLHINLGSDLKQINLTHSDIEKFVSWLESKHSVIEKRDLKSLPLSPNWCFVFNEGIANKLMMYCYYKQTNGIALQRDYLIKNIEFYPVTNDDKTFFKVSFADLKSLDF